MDFGKVKNNFLHKQAIIKTAQIMHPKTELR